MNNMKSLVGKVVASILLYTASPAAWTAFDPVNEDTDIFLANPALTTTRPNVLFFVDNSANWGSTSGGVTKFSAVVAALNAALSGVITDKYNVGLGLFAESGAPNTNTDGGYIRYGIRQMTGTTSNPTSNKGALLSVINSLDIGNDRGNGAKYSVAFAEIFKYYGGLTSRAGHGKTKADAGDSIYLPSGRVTLAGSPLPASALPGTSAASAYTSPISDGCQKNFIIYISNGEANDNTSDITTATTNYTTDIGSSPTPIPLNPNGSQGIVSDEYAKFMAVGDCNAAIPGTQNVFTYTIDIIPRTVGGGPAHTALLKSMAVNGKGKYFAVTDISNTTQLSNIFTRIFEEVQAVNSVFASTTLPVSVNVRGTNLNQVYIGVFRPDESKSPRWFGNLKLYRLGADTATKTLFLADANGDPAENASTGFITSSAKSFWSEVESPGFWAFGPRGFGGDFDSPDGDLVEKGGAAQQLRMAFPTSQSTRNIYTCISGSGLCANNASLSATPFNTSNITAANLGVASATDRDAIVGWVRGADNRDDENLNTVSTDIRASIHGDVLHSRPAIINYNRYGDDNDIYAFYGSNDGLFRAVKGGTAYHSSGADVALKPGTERWSFIPREFFSKLNRLREQSPLISSTNRKDYFFDGSIGVYQKDANSDGKILAANGDKVYLYASLRRGGNFIYALDVTSPADPKLLWRKGFGDTGWEQVGQTWSNPRVTRINADLGNASNPDNIVLIFGAGYEPAVEDITPCLLNKATLSGVERKAIGTGTVAYTSTGSCTIENATGSATSFSRTTGRGILVVDAFNGNVVWQAGGGITTSSTAGARKLLVPNMTCSISSDISVVDINRDGFADRAYVGDNCGQMWRMDLFGTDMNEWRVTRLAGISSSTDSDVNNKRKFMYPPDLVFGTDATGSYTAVLAGTGDREHPFDALVTNRFYMFKDREDGTEPLRGAANSTTVKISGFATAPTGSPYTDSSLFDATSLVVDTSDTLSLNGWKVTLRSGEKVVSSATTAGGSTFFNTNQPKSAADEGVCSSNLGVAREYVVGFATAAATQDLNALGNLSLANRSTIRAGGGFLPSPVPVAVDIGGTKYEAVISGTSVRTPPTVALDKRIRVYWYKEVD